MRRDWDSYLAVVFVVAAVAVVAAVVAVVAVAVAAAAVGSGCSIERSKPPMLLHWRLLPACLELTEKDRSAVSNVLTNKMTS